MMVRSFLPIGQGACYLERFHVCDDEGNNITVLYDCGSMTSLQLLEDCLSNNLNDGSTIHAVFISHFDEDHVNGLPYLLRNYRVKHLFIPLITERELKCIRLSCLCGAAYSSDAGFFRAFFDSFPYFRGVPYVDETVVHFMKSYRNNENSIWDERTWDIEYQSIESGEDVSHIICDRAKCSLADDWVFVPFNFDQGHRVNALIDALQSEMGFQMTLDDALLCCENDPCSIKKIKNAYNTIQGSINANSMVLFSGPRHYHGLQYDYSRCDESNNCIEKCRNKCLTRAGCLYMGDYDASSQMNWAELKRAFSDYWNMIGCIQIPHHGSKYSYNTEITNSNERRYVVSAGKENRFRHPHGIVIKDMLLKGVFPHIVTEEPSTEFVLIVEF